MTRPSPLLMTCEQLARHLGVTVRFVRRLVGEQRVPFIKIGKFVRSDPDQIDRWIADLHRTSNSAPTCRRLQPMPQRPAETPPRAPKLR